MISNLILFIKIFNAFFMLIRLAIYRTFKTFVVKKSISINDNNIVIIDIYLIYHIARLNIFQENKKIKISKLFCHS
jgi:hypothetical protein